MSQRPAEGTMGKAAKKVVVLAMLGAAVGILLVFLVLAKGGSKASKIVAEGDRAPEFTLPALDGRKVGLADFRGKVVMVHFWATWCPPCVEEIPTLDRLLRTMAGTDFIMLPVSVDEGGAESVRSFLERNRLTLPVLLDPGHETANRYGTFKFPETYVLDRSGMVKYKVIGPRNWDDPVTIQALRDLAAAN